jgi:putative oxidoreductase
MLKTLGRMLLASIFISGGANTFMKPDGRAEKVAAAGIPQPRQATILNGAVMAVGGAALAAGIAPKLAATALLGTLIPTTVVGHQFWKEETPAGKAGQQVQFLKNVAILGGLLLVLADNSHEDEA